jgi:hypothetical protein
VREAKELLRLELAFAKEEIIEEIHKTKVALISLATGDVLVIIGACCS